MLRSPGLAAGETFERKIVLILDAHARLFQLRGGKKVSRFWDPFRYQLHINLDAQNSTGLPAGHCIPEGRILYWLRAPMVLLIFVFGILLLGWLIAGLVVLATGAIVIVWTLERMLGRPGRFLARDLQFLRDIGIRP